MNFDEIEKNLISEIKLTPIQAKVFLLLVGEGKWMLLKLHPN